MSVTIWTDPQIAYEGYLHGIHNKPWKVLYDESFPSLHSYEVGRHVAAFIKSIDAAPRGSFDDFQTYVGKYNMFCREMKDECKSDV